MRTVLDFHQGRARSDLLFTMSNNTRTPERTRTGANFSFMDEQGTPRMRPAPKRAMLMRACAHARPRCGGAGRADDATTTDRAD